MTQHSFSISHFYQQTHTRFEFLHVPNASKQASNIINLSKNVNNLSFLGARGDAVLGCDEVASDVLSLLGRWLTTFSKNSLPPPFSSTLSRIRFANTYP